MVPGIAGLLWMVAVVAAIIGMRRLRNFGPPARGPLVAAAVLVVAGIAVLAIFWKDARYWQLDPRKPLPCGDYGCPNSLV